MPVERCVCHGEPLPWCEQGRLDAEGQAHGAPPIGPDGLAHLVETAADGSWVCLAGCPGWHEGTVVHAPHGGFCGHCSGPYEVGELVVKLPMPVWSYPYAHEQCTR